MRGQLSRSRISRGFSASTKTIVIPNNRLMLESGLWALLMESGGYLLQG